MKKFEITIGWEIRDTRDITGGYYTGISTLVVEASRREMALNSAIDFARHLPSSEFERNGIDLEQYRDAKYCRYYYITMISKVLTIKEVK